MNMEATRWVLGILLALILGSYGYTFINGRVSASESAQIETRIERQLDIIERKVDRVIEEQWKVRNNK